jgi:hypothetical protein
VDITDKAVELHVVGDSHVNLDVIAADAVVGRFSRFDVHGVVADPCIFWAMTIPTS